MSELWISELKGAAVVSVLVLGLLALTGLQKRLGVASEISRKTAHLGAGLLALPFPYLFRSVWTVVALTGSFLALVTAGKLLGRLQGVHGVERKSLGAFAYPIMVAVMFWLAQGDPLMFQIPILVLAVSDMLAALIGKGYGSVHFRVVGERRSIEGSSAFFVATFLLVHLPLLLSERTGRLESVLIAFSAAALVTCFEAISVWGLDNVFIPYGTWFVLAHFLRGDLAGHWRQLELIAVFGALSLAAIRLRLLRGSGAIAVFLSIYGAYNLGGPRWFWAMAGVCVFLIALGVPFRRGRKDVAPWELSQVFHLVIVGIVLLFIHDWTRQPWLFVPYIAALSASAAVVVAMLVASMRKEGPSQPSFRVVPWTAGALAALLPFPAPLLLTDANGELREALAALAGGLTAMLAVAAMTHTAANFRCSRCSVLTRESRHCDEASILLSGRRVWTRNRLHLVGTALGSLLGLGVSAALALL